MKKKVMRFLACFLIIGLVLPTAMGTFAFADNEEETSPAIPDVSAPAAPAAPESASAAAPSAETVVSGEGTPADPKLTESTVVVVDSETGNTTVTVSDEKEWHDDTVTGSETGKASETRDKDGNLINAEGNIDGNETVIVDSKTRDNGESVTVDNGVGTTEDGKTVNTEVPDITLNLAPGKDDTKSETVDAWFDEATLDLPSWVRSEENGESIWAKQSHSEIDGVTDDISVETDEATNTTTYIRTIIGADGKTVRETVKCTRNAAGKITDYSVVTDEIESTAQAASPSAQNSAYTLSEGNKTYSFELPEKPAVAEPSYAPDGSVENGQFVAELCDASGKVVGYTVVTVENGNVVGYGEPILGRYCVTETVVETLENGLKKLTTTKTYTTSVTHSAKNGSVGNGERTANGWMSEEVSGTVEKSGVKTYQPYLVNGKDGSIDASRELYNRPNEAYTGSDELFIRWCGEYGIESTIRVKQGEVMTWQPHQFVLDGQDGAKYYVYCCDFEVSPTSGADYNIKRLEDADYYKNNDNGKAQDQIRAIVLNGYWGVEDESSNDAPPTPGSLEAFRQMLVDAGELTADEAAKITDGMALTATQAAIWYYGNSGSDLLSDTDIVGKRNLGNGEFEKVDDEKRDIINKAYAYLIKKLPGVSATQDNTVLTPEDFKFAESLNLTVGKKVDETNYYTDITFTMAVSPDDEAGDLIVYISDSAGNIIGAYRLCGDSSEDGESVSAAVKNDDGSFTLPGVFLPAGDSMSFNLNLKGTQKLNNGVYLFNCTAGEKASQTFIGCGAVTQTVNLTVQFGFNVSDPVIALQAMAFSSASEQYDWTSEFYTYDDDGGDGGGDDDGGGRNFDVPKTGDGMLAVQIALAFGAALSLAGTALFLSRARKAEIR